MCGCRGAVPVDQLAAEGYTGRARRPRDKDYKATLPAPGQAHWQLTRPLAPHEGMTVVLSFPKGLVPEPSRAQRVHLAAQGQPRRAGRPGRPDAAAGVLRAPLERDRSRPQARHRDCPLRPASGLFAGGPALHPAHGPRQPLRSPPTCLRWPWPDSCASSATRALLKDEWTLVRLATAGRRDTCRSRNACCSASCSPGGSPLVLKDTNASTMQAAQIRARRQPGPGSTTARCSSAMAAAWDWRSLIVALTAIALVRGRWRQRHAADHRGAGADGGRR